MSNPNNLLDILQPAQRINRNARIGISGASGHGKSMTMLRFASVFSERSGKPTVVLDTEKESVSLYAANPGEAVDNEFKFDFVTGSLEEPYTTTHLIKLITAIAESGQYGTLCIDSLSHYWFAPGGILDQAHMLETTTRMNGFQAIAKAKELYYYPLVEAIIGLPIHLIVSLRAKNAYDIGKDANNKTTITRLGEAPRFEESFLYELDLSVVMGPGNTMTVDKTRFADYSDSTVSKPRRDWIVPFADWLQGGVEDPYVYADRKAVSNHPAARRIFNEYLAAHNGEVPLSADALKQWHEKQTAEAAKVDAGAQPTEAPSTDES